jgi:hypothetical protein
MFTPTEDKHPGASPELIEVDKRSMTIETFKASVDPVRRTQKPAGPLRSYQSESHKMKQMALNGATVHMPQMSDKPTANPIWTNFPTKCVRPIRSVEEMRQKLQYYAHSDEVMLVRYHQSNCTACNAVDKTYEFLCHGHRKSLPNLHYYDVKREDLPELTKGLVRYPQVKGFSGGQWVDLEFKPRQAYRDSLYSKIEKEVESLEELGSPVTAVQAEEMYFSAAGPAMKLELEASIMDFYLKSKRRMHNYWKQVSVRRSWFFTKFVQPRIPEDVAEEWSGASVFGEKVVATAEPLRTDF